MTFPALETYVIGFLWLPDLYYVNYIKLKCDNNTFYITDHHRNLYIIWKAISSMEY